MTVEKRFDLYLFMNKQGPLFLQSNMVIHRVIMLTCILGILLIFCYHSSQNYILTRTPGRKKINYNYTLSNFGKIMTCTGHGKLMAKWNYPKTAWVPQCPMLSVFLLHDALTWHVWGQNFLAGVGSGHCHFPGLAHNQKVHLSLFEMDPSKQGK